MLGSPSSTTTSPNTSVIGNPTANRFSAGAARLVTPKARLITSSAVMPGSATRSAPDEQLRRPSRRATCSALGEKPVRPDRQAAKARDQRLDQRDVAVERQEGERAEHHVQLPERRRLDAAQRIDVEREPQSHAVGEQLAAEG